MKGRPPLFEREADVLKVPVVEKPAHPAERPLALLERLIEVTNVEGELVADPFAGVASTLVAAKKSKRLYWGAEINPDLRGRQQTVERGGVMTALERELARCDREIAEIERLAETGAHAAYLMLMALHDW